MVSRPVIVVVDDEPSSLSGVLDALVRRFGADYRVVSFLSANAALEALEKMRQDEEQVALVIADQWMPEMSGLELLARAHQIHRSAQRALFVSWFDHSATPMILRGCGVDMLDNYLHKPWSPPEVHLYPAVSEFLAEWTRAHGPRMELVQVVGEHPSARSHEVRELLERNAIPYGFYVAGTDAANRLLERVAVDGSRLPVVLLLDGHVLIQPTNREIADAIGSNDFEDRHCDVAIVGAGPSGPGGRRLCCFRGSRGRW